MGITAEFLSFNDRHDTLYSYNPSLDWFRTSRPDQTSGPHILGMKSLDSALISLVKYLQKCPNSEIDFTGHTCRSSSRYDPHRLTLDSAEQYHYLGDDIGCGCGTNSANSLRISLARSMEFAYFVVACYFTEPGTRAVVCPMRSSASNLHLNWNVDKVKRFLMRRLFRRDDSFDITAQIHVTRDYSLVTAPLIVSPVSFVEGAGGSRCLNPHSTAAENRRVSITVWHRE